MGQFKILLLFTVIVTIKAAETEKPPPTITRTEIKVSRSLNPDDMQTLNVMTKDGNVAQLIVKRRDPKVKNNHDDEARKTSQFSRAIYTNWIPVSSFYYHPNIIRLDTIALVRNGSQENKPNVIDSDRIPNVPSVPKPVTIRSGDIYIKNERKRARSIMQVDQDGIPIVHGVRVADDDSDKQTWRNARVINGELVPYEEGYKPPVAIPIGQLIYASQNNQEKDDLRSIGPFTKQDNFKSEVPNVSIGPFSVKDNLPGEKPKENEDYVRFNSQTGIGPFTKADNAKITNSKLIDYIKEINAKESKRDYFARRNYRSYEDKTQMQRRMLQYPGQYSYPNSLLYTPSKLSPVTFNEGVRTPVLQYAHPELGVQPAKATPEEEEMIQYKDQYEIDSGRHSQYYDNNVNTVDYYRKDVMNYPYNTYYIKRKPEQPFWIKITETIKDNVQNGFARMQQLTRPVFEPLVEATHKISHNLGFSKESHAQDKVGLIAPMSSSVILPALGLVAGGAALGLGAAAVGRFLNPLEMRSFHGANPNDIVLIMEEPSHQEQEEHKRFRRNVEDEFYMQQLITNVEKDNSLNHLAAPHLWSDTPCAKKVFCDVMIRQNEDEVVLMEKKMDTLMAMVHPDVANSVSHHLQEVMDAIKMRDCSKFYCSRRYPFSAPAA